MTILFGPAHALVNLSARQAGEMGHLTSGIFGLTGITSSESANLASSLASRFQARTRSLGSTLYRLTWKVRTTPQRRSIYAQRASAPPISDSASFGWPTPAARDWKGATLERWGENSRPLNEVAVLSGWPTPVTANAHSYPTENAKDASRDLPTSALLSGWATPCALDGKGLSTFPADSNQSNLNRDMNRFFHPAGWPTPSAQEYAGNPEASIARKQALGIGNTCTILSQVATLSGWPTPTANPKDQPETHRGLETLAGSVKLSGWPTPTTESNTHCYGPDKTILLKTYGAARLADPLDQWPSGTKANLVGFENLSAQPARLTATGHLLTGLLAGMGSGGQLNPGHSRWLMGLPPEWDACAVMAMPSLPRSRKNSSARILT